MKRFLLGCSLLICCSYNGYADDLNHVLAYSYENNLTIAAGRAGQKMTDEEVAKAKSGYRPTIMADGSYGRAHDKIEMGNAAGQATYNQNPSTMQVSLTQPIFSGLSTRNAVQSAKKQVESGRHALVNTEQLVLLDTVRVYMDVIRDKAVLELQENEEKVLLKHLESYRKRFKAGELTRTDVAQSEARASGATAKRIAAQGNLKMSEAVFYSVVGMQPNELQDVKDLPITLPTELDAAIELAMKQNPQILAAQYAQESAKYNVQAQKGNLLPSINVGAAAGRINENTSVDQNDYWKLTANVSIPLYQSGAEYANIRQAKQAENRYRILWNQTLQDVHAEVVRAWENYQSSKAQVESIQTQIKASKLALEGVIREAKVGARTVLDVLDAEQEYLDNQVALIQVHREEIVSAFALLSSVGQMNPSYLGLDVQT